MLAIHRGIEEVDLTSLLAAAAAWTGESLGASGERRRHCVLDGVPEGARAALEMLFAGEPWATVSDDNAFLPRLEVTWQDAETRTAPVGNGPEDASGMEARLILTPGVHRLDAPENRPMLGALTSCMGGGGRLSARLFVREYDGAVLLAVLFVRMDDVAALEVDPEAFGAIEGFYAVGASALNARLDESIGYARRSLSLAEASIGSARAEALPRKVIFNRLRKALSRFGTILMNRLRHRSTLPAPAPQAPYAPLLEDLKREVEQVASSKEAPVQWKWPAEDKRQLRVGFYSAQIDLFGGLEQWMCDLAGRLESLGHKSFIIIRDCVGGDCRALRVFDGPLLSLEGHCEDLGPVVAHHELDVLMVSHVYDGLQELQAGPLVVEVLHNIYFWQRMKKCYAEARSRVDDYIAPSSAAMDYAVNYLGLPAERTCLIPHRLNPRGLCRPHFSYLKRRLGASDFTIVDVGNIFPQKNHVCLIKAFARLRREYPTARLRIVGAISDQYYYKRMTDVIRELRLADSVEMTGPLDRAQVSRALADANLFALPSLFEGFGLAALEARYFGLPLVLSNTGHSSRLVRREVDGMIADVASPFESLSQETVDELSYDPPEKSVESLHGCLAHVRANYPDICESSFEAMNDAELFDFNIQVRDYLDRFQRGLVGWEKKR